MPTVPQTLSNLLSYFQTGDTPTQDQFEELIRTVFYLYDLQAANAAAAAASTAAVAADPIDPPAVALRRLMDRPDRRARRNPERPDDLYQPHVERHVRAMNRLVPFCAGLLLAGCARLIPPPVAAHAQPAVEWVTNSVALPQGGVQQVVTPKRTKVESREALVLPKQIRLGWNYPVNLETPDLVFNLYHSPQLVGPLRDWPLFAVIPGSAREFVVTTSQPSEFFVLTASNQFGESHYATP